MVSQGWGSSCRILSTDYDGLVFEVTVVWNAQSGHENQKLTLVSTCIVFQMFVIHVNLSSPSVGYRGYLRRCERHVTERPSWVYHSCSSDGVSATMRTVSRGGDPDRWQGYPKDLAALQIR